MKYRKTITFISQVAIFGGLAAILYCVPVLQFQLPFVAPGFMSVHLDDIPILLSSFAYGPLVGLSEVVLKTLIKLPMTSTACAGEIGDMFYSLCLIIPASWIYTKHRTFKGCLAGIGVGLVLNLIASTIVNLYTIFPMYKAVYGLPEGFIAESFNKIFGWELSGDGDPLIAILLLPFNLIKNAIIIGVTMVSYKPLRFIFEKLYREK